MTVIAVLFSLMLKAQDADSLRAKILQCFDESRFVEVIEYTKQALPLYEEAGDLYNVAGCYNTIAGACMRLGQYDEAIRNYNICTEIMDEIGGEMAAVNKRYIMNNIASIYYDMEEYDLSEELYWKCIEMLGETGTDTVANLNLATYYQNISGVRLMQYGQMDDDDPRRDATLAETIDYAEQALALSKRYGDWQEKIINRRIALSKAYHAAGRLEEADAELDTAIIAARQVKELYYETAIVMLYGQYAFDRGDTDAAEQFYLEALDMAKESHYDQFYLECLQGAYLATRSSHPERSLSYLEESVKIRDTIYNEEMQDLVRDYQVKYQLAEKQYELELQEEKARQNIRLFNVSLVVVALLLIVVIALILNVIQRKRRNEMLLRLNSTKDQLFTMVSHDIKTPVLAQEKVLDLMSEHINDIPLEYIKEYLVALQSSTKDMKIKLVNLISWVKGMLVDADKQTEFFNLRETVDKVVQSQAFEIDLKSLKVTNDIPANWVGNDDSQIVEMVLQNIVSNAVKYSYDKGEIRLEAEDDGKHYMIKVIDHGKGISKDKLGKLMQMLTSSTEGTGGESGTGIGLFVSKQIMERNGGIIMIESEEGEGTTVTISVRKGE